VHRQVARIVGSRSAAIRGVPRRHEGIERTDGVPLWERALFPTFSQRNGARRVVVRGACAAHRLWLVLSHRCSASNTKRSKGCPRPAASSQKPEQQGRCRPSSERQQARRRPPPASSGKARTARTASAGDVGAVVVRRPPARASGER